MLRDLIASSIAGEKSYNVPAVCRRFGLKTGTDEEAHRSKFTYVSSRLRELGADRIFDIATSVQQEFPSYALGELLAKLSEASQPVVTELTRRRIVTALEGIPLSGVLPEIEFLGKIWPLDELSAPSDSLEHNMSQHLSQHYIRNDDLDARGVLEALNIYSCSRKQFFRFLEILVDPLTRELPDQMDLVTRLNVHLLIDGYALREVGRLSGSPRFEVRPATEGTTPADSGIGEAFAAFNPNEIHGRWEEALKRRSADPRAAITLARTILEDTCKWIIHEAQGTYKDEDDLPALYRNLAKILKLAPDDYTEQVFKQILGSCQSIVEALGALRNKLGDAHAQGPLRAKPLTRHAELAVNLAGTMATFLIATWEAKATEKKTQGAQVSVGKR
jgi:hypothetical protein